MVCLYHADAQQAVIPPAAIYTLIASVSRQRTLCGHNTAFHERHQGSRSAPEPRPGACRCR